MKKGIIGLVIVLAGIVVLFEYQFFLLSIAIYCFGFALLLIGAFEYCNQRGF